MKPQLYPFRLYKPDQANRKRLIAYYSKKRDRPVDFATILRELMQDAVDDIGE